MKKGLIAVLSLAMLLGGCAQKVSYGDAQEAETTTIEFGSTDLQKIAVEMTDSMLASGSVAYITA
ncbi:penicillin-binding protein activator LpoB, partial [Neptunomonas phycophila]|nr:penicillin-binding protein activator LpoB [Neptunomonas phycophila]